ncbi:MAG: hypothetical protein BWY59_00991 [Verrucomicrobia bacterium ADurb.Bin345]|nr:MAG: hypothetical protein BWY59_00991 [Verrucomicrobia bacterium ADurb.Bin345]
MALAQFTRRALADVRHAQRIKPFFQRQGTRRLAGGDEFGRVFFAKHPRLLGCAEIKRRERFERYVIEVRRITHEIEFDKLGGHRLTEAVDGQRPPAAEKSKPPGPLRAAVVVLAFPRRADAALRVDLDLGNFPTAHGAFAADGREQIELRRARRALLRKRFQHRGNHLARALDLHEIAHTDILAADFLLVVERRAGDRRARKRHGFQLGDRREGAGAADLDRDCGQPRLRLLVRVLERDREARRLGGCAEPLPLIEVVHLHHGAVDLVGQGGLQLLQLLRAGDDLLDIAAPPPVLRCGESEAPELLEDLGMLRERDAPGFADGIEDGGERAARDHAGIQLLERARRGVARIREGFLAFCLALGVQFPESVDREIGLAADLEDLRRAGGGKRNVPDGLDVGGDVVACRSVAARRADDQRALFVTDADGDPVHLRFQDVLHGLAGQELAHACVELAQLVERVRVVERHHRDRVAHGREFLQRFAADALGGGVGRDERGELRFEVLEFAVEAVVFAVGNFRPGLDVVQAVVAVELLAELLDPGSGFSLVHRRRRSVCVLPDARNKSKRRRRPRAYPRSNRRIPRCASGRKAGGTRRAPRRSR